MSKLTIERIGGYAGIGGANSHVRSSGEIEIEDLSKEDKQTVEDLFKSKENADSSITRDSFIYKISRMTSNGIETIEADENRIPFALTQSVKDEFR